MQIFSRLFDFYKDVNPSTLTGAVDVVVVEDVSTGRLTSSPFHVRFGKLQVLRPSEKKVEIEVNGRAVEEVSMKIGMAGETFFVLPVEGPVPSEYQTSPLPEPIRASPGDLPKITLSASPPPPPAASQAMPIEPLSDSEIDAGEQPVRYKTERSALSDSELDTAVPADKEEWSWKWGDLPTKEPSKDVTVEEATTQVNATTVNYPSTSTVNGPSTCIESTVTSPSSTTPPETVSAAEAEILGLAPPVPPRPEALDPLSESPVLLPDYLSRRSTIALMYGRLVEIVAEGVEEVELCLLHSDPPPPPIRPGELASLKTVSAALPTVGWDAFQCDPEASLHSAYVCVFGRSTKCAIFPTKGALQMLVGLRLYKRLIPLERLLGLMGLEAGEGEREAVQGEGESPAGILSWRQWWSSPRSQSSKAVPAPPSPTKSAMGTSMGVGVGVDVGVGGASSPTKSLAGSVRSPSKQPAATRAADSLPDLVPGSPPKATASSPSAAPLSSSPVASAVPPSAHVNYAKSLRLPSADLQKLNLHYGMNTITFSVSTSKNGRAVCAAHIFLWRSDDRIVISDIDGTITKYPECCYHANRPLLV